MRDLGHRYRDLLHPVRIVRFGRPLVLFHSDDWGLVRIRDRESFQRLVRAGFRLGADPFDYASCETAADVRTLCDVLSAHRDSIGSPPAFVCNFVLANVDFARVLHDDLTEVTLKPVHEGWPAPWERDGLLAAYRTAVQQARFYPGLHGVTHFCHPAMRKHLTQDGVRREALRSLFSVGTPLVYSQTPWVGYEYREIVDSRAGGWLPYAEQQRAITQGAELFRLTFGIPPRSACAPGYHANGLTVRAWAQAGLRVIHHGPGISAPPFLGRYGLLYLYRNIPFESAWEPDDAMIDRALSAGLQRAAAGEPLVVYTHSVNFHSTLRNYRDATLDRLDRFLSRLEETFDDLLYVHDEDLWNIVTRGWYVRQGRTVRVDADHRWTPRGRVRSRNAPGIQPPPAREAQS